MTNTQHKNIQYGCVIFDDPDEHQAGYAAKAGGKARRIRGTRDLSSDTVWITNLSYEHSFKSGFHRHARFRSEHFLRVTIEKLLKLHNIQDPATSAELVAIITDRVSKITYDFCDIGFEPGQDIKQMIRQSFVTGYDPVAPEYVCKALMDATSYFSTCERPVSTFTWQQQPQDAVFFQIHPFIITSQVLALDLPYGPKWEKVHVSRISKSAFKTFDSLKEEIGAPFLARTKVVDINEQYNAVLNFGSSPAYNSRRQWLSSTEIETLYGIAKLDITEFMIPKDHAPYLSLYLKKLLELPEVCQTSLSYRIFVDCLWCAAGTNYKPPIQRAVPYDLINPATPFVRAMDREICMNTAIMLTHLGFEVTGYGAGNVRVIINDQTPEQILEAAIKTNTIPPMIPGADLTLENIDSPLLALQVQYLNARTDMIMHYDEQITGKMYGQAQKNAS